MSAVNVFLGIMGVAITGLVIAGMIFLKPHHLVSPAPQTDLSDVKPDKPAGPNINRPPAIEPAVEPPREQVTRFAEHLNDGDRPMDDGRRRVQPKEQA